MSEDFNLGSNLESVQAYIEDKLHMDSEIHFFDISLTGDNIKIEKYGKKYIQLFSLELGAEFYSNFKDYFRMEKFNLVQKAYRLLEYRINDA